MIRVSTRGRYALRAVVDVACNAGEGATARQQIAERQGISADYVAQLFRKLREAGIVKGVRGPGGGYVLARDPAAITAGDVVRAVEGPLAVVHCVEPAAASQCDRAATCVTRSVWRRLSEVMAEFLDSITVQDLCEDAGRLQQDCGARQSGWDAGGG